MQASATFLSFAFLAVSVALAGCAIVGDGPWEVVEGRNFSTDAADGIIEGRTTEREVIQNLGSPLESFTKDNSRKNLRYYVKERRTSTAVSPLKDQTTYAFFEKELLIELRNGVVSSKTFRTKDWLEKPQTAK